MLRANATIQNHFANARHKIDCSHLGSLFPVSVSTPSCLALLSSSWRANWKNSTSAHILRPSSALAVAFSLLRELHFLSDPSLARKTGRRPEGLDPAAAVPGARRSRMPGAPAKNRGSARSMTARLARRSAVEPTTA